MVLKTLELVVNDITALDAATHKLQAAPTDANLAAAASAWRAARSRWRQGTVFEFGPSAYYNFDKQLSSWPLDRNLVDHVIGQIAAGKLSVDARYLRERLHSTQRGFLAAEYLLFRDGQPRKAEDVSAAELGYLTAVTEAMAIESMDYRAAWLGTGNVPAEQAAALAAAGLQTRPPYVEEFKHPGRSGSRYFSPSGPLQEIFQDSVAAVEAMCPAIAEVLGSADPLASYTWFSRNGLADIQSELKGVENAYLGGVEGKRGSSISELLAVKSKVLDRRIRIALADTAYRIAAAGDPYGEPREDRALTVRIAEAACRKLLSRLTAAMPLVCMDPSTRPWAAYGQ
jgi:predicted lipoprotein